MTRAASPLSPRRPASRSRTVTCTDAFGLSKQFEGWRAEGRAAGQRERKRLERDLHDGAQQRLIALSLDLSLLEEGLTGRPRNARSGSIGPGRRLPRL